MDMPERTISMSLQQKTSSVSLQDYVEIFWRRKWLFVIPLVIGVVAAYVLCDFLPPSYRSSTLILVDAQKVPSSYITPTVTGTVNDRLRTISQEIMSRTNLSRIIKEYSLYKPEESAPAKRDDFVERVREKGKRLLSKYGLLREGVSMPLHQDEVPEEIIIRMRKDIEVKVTGKEAFSVAYNGRDPNTVMRVTNTLALLFIEENLKVRERQAEGTSEFLESQLGEVERELQRQEGNIREFQQRHRGALPAQLDANLRTLDRLQQELNSINDSIKSAELQAEERKHAVEEQRRLQELMRFTNQQPTAPESVVPKPNPKLEALKQDLARLRATFNENYPDIISIKKQIEELSQTATQQPEPSAPTSAVPNESRPARAGEPQGGAALATLSAANSATERNLAVLRSRHGQISTQMRKLEESVNATPANEEKLTALTRDYGMTLRNYQSLLDKRLHAKISENLEKKQKGEQFRILDPANLPANGCDRSIPNSMVG
jgi:polysaccharide biosynthesis transport protein